MKKLLLSAITLIIFVSCAETLNDKAEALIKDDMKRTLVNPKSYKAIETKTDSAFAPQDDPLLYSLMLDIARENITISDAESTIAEFNDNMINAENGMKMALKEKRKNYKDDYNKFSKIYDTCKSGKENVELIRDSISNLIGNKLEQIKKRLNTTNQFIGYKSIHKYSAENVSDTELKDSCFYLFDKDMKKVVLSLPLQQYRSLTETLNVIREGIESTEEDSIK